MTLPILIDESFPYTTLLRAPVAKITPITEHFQHFLADMKESFWGDVYGQTKLAWQGFLELESQRQRDRFSGWGRYERDRKCTRLELQSLRHLVCRLVLVKEN